MCKSEIKKMQNNNLNKHVIINENVFKFYIFFYFFIHQFRYCFNFLIGHFCKMRKVKTQLFCMH